jgi:transposase
LRTLPIGRRPVWLRLFVPRVECRQCGCIRQVKLPFSSQKKRDTKRLERLIVELSRLMSMRDVALYLKVGFRISTGPLEATNNKIGALQRRAYGYREMEFFKLRILGLHEAKYAFTG